LTINNFGSVVETRTIDIYLDDYQDRESVLCGFKFERVLFSLPDTHSFGVVYCEKCGCIIPRSRLIAVNGARRCVNCLD
jgi:formylmethanofuran dehydrogenase subunit E